MPILDVGPLGPDPADGPGVCTAWATVADVCAPCNTYDFDPTLLEDGLLAASNVLFDLTGRRWPGECVTTIYPCREPAGPRAALSGPWWQSNRFLRSTRDCRRLRLPGGPTGIESVTVDGMVIPSDVYELQGRDLVRVDGDVWPCCVGCGPVDADDFAVTYPYGTVPPIGGRIAAAVYGCQIALACDDATSGACKLPANVQTLLRQGVSVTLPDPTQLAQDGLTGLPEVDRWVASVLIGQRRRPATIVMPGGGRRRSPAFWPRWF